MTKNQEHDCLPPLEHIGSWELSANAIKRLTEVFQKIFPTVSKADKTFEELRRLSALLPRGYHKAIRWEEKNRRRRLKGLPEKPCPYQDRMKKENDQSRDDEKVVKLDEHKK